MPFLLWGTLGACWGAQDALVTSLTGTVQINATSTKINVLKPFFKLQDGDLLTLKENARLQLVFFSSGRQEAWVGSGVLEVGDVQSKVIKGDLTAEVKQLPAILVKQLAKTPAVEEIGRSGMSRLRSLHTEGAVDAIEKAYAEFRSQTPATDHSPELYLLASYLELREFDKVLAKLQEMVHKYPDDSEVIKLDILYRTAITNAKR